MNKLEKVLRQIGGAIILAASIGGCTPTVNNNTPDEITVTIDTPQVGMIMGRTVIPLVANNQIFWYGQSGAEVDVKGTGLKTNSISSGMYSISEIPTGIYDITARWKKNSQETWDSKPEPALVTSRGLTEVSDLKLIPSYNSGKEIIHGRIYSNKEKTSPFIGNLRVCRLAHKQDGSIIPGTELGNTVTSSDGYYAIQGDFDNVVLQANSSIIKFFADEQHPTDYYYTTISGMKEIEGFVP
jgi:hypothetical protein